MFIVKLIRVSLSLILPISFKEQIKRSTKIPHKIFYFLHNVYFEYKKKNVECYINKKNFCNPQDPVFSFVIPIYDRTEQLEEAIDSALNQTFKNFEVILITDGSPWETIQVVESYKNHPQVRIHHFPDNSGNACRGRNKGIEISKGKIISLLDSDDLAMPNRLYDTFFHMLLHDADAVYGAVKLIIEDSNSRSIQGAENGHITFPYPFDFNKLKEINTMYACTVSVKKKCLKKYGSFRPEMRYREDQELWLRLAYRGCKFYAIQDKVLSAYRFHDSNLELKFLPEDEIWKDLMLKLYKEEKFFDLKEMMR